MNADDKTIEFSIQGVNQGVAFTGITDTEFFPAISVTEGADVTFNFGATSFNYTVPEGYNNWV